MILLVIADGQPMCNTSVARSVLPSENVTLLCQVNINGTTKLNASLIQGGHMLSTSNSKTVTWTGLALNLITVNVTCVAPAEISSTQCPTIQGTPSL